MRTLMLKDSRQKQGMKPHALNRRLQEINGKHLNQFIREVRLRKALELLLEEKYTAAEVAYKVGFSSPAYFNKCFHDFYGYSPGKVKISGMLDPAQNGFVSTVIRTQNQSKAEKDHKNYFACPFTAVTNNCLFLRIL